MNSIQTKIALILIFTVTVILSGYGVVNFYAVKAGMENDLKELSEFIANQQSEALSLPMWDMDSEGIEIALNSLMSEKRVFAILIRDKHGKTILNGTMRDENWNVIKAGSDISGDYHVKTKDITKSGMKLGTAEIYLTYKFIDENLRVTIFRMIITFVIINVSLVCSLFIGVRKSILLPVERIVEIVRIIASGQLDTAVPKGGNDEIGQLASDVESMRLAIKDLTENLKEKERLKNEMELARKIQTVLLPNKPKISGYEIRASCEPADEVGGDYYDVISVGGFDWIIVGDVSGHGVTSGLIMMMVQTAIHSVLLDNPEVKPAALLTAVNKTIYQNIRKMDEIKHMTIVVLAAGKNGDFRFTGLHEDILIRRAATGKVETVQTDGMWIGLEPDIGDMLTEDRLLLNPGDCMVLYTDGIIEAWKADHSMYGEKQLVGIVRESGHKSAAEIHDDILESLKSYEKPDDVTLLVVKRV